LTWGKTVKTLLIVGVLGWIWTVLENCVWVVLDCVGYVVVVILDGYCWSSKQVVLVGGDVEDRARNTLSGS
jgi:hypothetical protein